MKNNFYKILSIILSVAMIFSVCGTVASADTTFGENAFFVKNGGTGDGTSDTNPAPTVYAAIETINKTLGEGDVANIYIMQREDWADVNSDLDGSTKPVHGLTAWAVDSAVPPTHEAQIIVQPYPDNSGTTYLATGDKYGVADYMQLSGPTTIKNLVIITPSGYKGIKINGQNVTFDADDQGMQGYGYLNAWPITTPTARWSTGTFFGAGAEVTDEVNISYNYRYTTHAITNTSWCEEKMYLGGYSTTDDVYNEDFNLNFDFGNSGEPRIVFGNNKSDITFKKNLNLNIISAKAIVLEDIGGDVTIEGAYQVIKDDSIKYTDLDSYVAGNSPTVDVESFEKVTVKGGSYILTNESDYSDLLAFTDTAGTYTVKSGYEAVATDILGNKYYSENGVLTVPVGEYTVDEYIPPVTKDYYVKYGGTGDGRSAASPVATVYDAVELVNADNLGENDIANIYILQDERWNTLNVNDDTKLVGKIDGVNTTVPHAMTAWAENGGAVPAHKAEIVVQAYDSSVTTHIAYSANIGENISLQLGGPTTFKNIVIVCMRGYQQAIYAAGNDLTFEESASYAFAENDCTASSPKAWSGTLKYRTAMAIYGGYYNGTHTIDKEVNITFNNKITVTGNRNESTNLDSAYATDTYTEDVTYTFNNSETKARIRIGNGSGGSSTYEKNLNIYIKSATALGVQDYNKAVTVNGGYQVIISGGAAYSGADDNTTTDTTWTELNGDISTFSDVTVKDGCWYITNESDYNDLLKFTSTAGRYIVKSGYTATAINTATGEKTDSENGFLTLTAGDYTVTATKIPVTKAYYVKSGGTGDGRSETAPAGSVVEVIASVNEDLIAGDIANVYIIKGDNRATAGVNEFVGDNQDGTISVPVHGFASWVNFSDENASNKKWDYTTPTHAAKIIIQGLDNSEDAPTYLAFSNRLGGNADMRLGGPTEFKDITIVGTRKNYRHIYHSGYSVTYGETAKYGYINHDYTNKNTEVTWNGKVTSAGALATCIGCASSNNSISGDINVTYENAYSGSSQHSSVHIDNVSSYKNEYENVNVTFNNSAAAPIVYLGAYGAGATTVKNLNIVVKNAKSLALATKDGTLTVTGALQILINGGATLSGDIFGFSSVTAAEGKWVVKVVTNMADALTLTNVAGTYAVQDGYTAIATDANGNEYLSDNGLLTLPAGAEYEVQVVDFYANNGETITVYNEVEIDLANEKHTYKDGMVFLGWQKADGSYAQQTETYARGDVLTAQYADFSADSFVIEETQIRTSDELGLRFVVKQNKETLAKLPEITEYGTITLPTDVAGGRDIYLDEAVVVEWTWDENDIYSFSPKTTGATPTKVVAENILEETEQTRRYTLCITGIEEDKYNTFYLAKGYIKYNDNNGVERVIYTADEQNSLYKIAAEALADGIESEVYSDIVNYVENVWEVNYLADLYEGSELLYTDPNDSTHKIIKLSNGLYERSVTINSGMNITSTELCFYTDPHLPYINRYDIDTKNINALASYRGRSWLRNGSSVNKQIAVSKYASTFDKAVMGGDAVDYLTWGALNITDNLITKKAVNNDTVMVVGNHEPKDLSQPDISGLIDIDLTEGYNRVSTAWTNDLYYYAEIVTDEKDNPNYMIVSLDNSNGYYWESQAESLQASIDVARELSIPILIFQHIPMLTMNPEETAVYDRDGFGNGGVFGSADNYSSVYNMNTQSGFLGDENDTAATLEVCSIIRSNADVIKGVFNGHIHANLYTEILGTDQEGNTVMIPQHTGYGSHYGGVMKITVK